MANPSTSRREALKAQQLAAEKAARNRKMVGLGAIVVAVLLVVILAVVLISQGGKGGGSVTPPNAVVNSYGVQAGTNPNSVKDGIGIAQDKAKPGAPVVQLYADYQCPGCKAFDDAFGVTLNELARSGEIKYSVQIETFLDRLGTNKSTNPAIGAACADVQGVFPEYHLAIFKGQPTKEGAGYTTEQLRSTFPAAAGLAGEKLTQFQSCFDTRATATFVDQQNKFNTAYTTAQYTKLGGETNADAKAWGSTPLMTVNGKRLDTTKLDAANQASLLEAIKATAG